MTLFNFGKNTKGENSSNALSKMQHVALLFLLVCVGTTSAGNGEEAHTYPSHTVWPAPVHVQKARVVNENGEPASYRAVVDVPGLELKLGRTATSSCSAILIAGFKRLLAGALGAKEGKDFPHTVQQATREDHADEVSAAEGDPEKIHGSPNLQNVARYNAVVGKISAVHVEIRGAAKLELGVDESYEVDVFQPKGGGDVLVNITAATQFGALYGLATFGQLVQWTGRVHVMRNYPMRVKDAPRFPWRGLMVDTARHFYPLSDLKRVVHGISLLKMNVFHWHIVDAQSFPFQSEVKPLLSQKGAFAPDAIYTIADVKELQAFAATRGVRLIPEFDMPAHASSWGNGYPELVVKCPSKPPKSKDVKTRSDVDCGAWCQLGKRAWAMNPIKEETYAFLSEFLPEVWETFTDEYMHFGGDEATRECWNADPGIRAASPGVNVHTLQGQFTERTQKMAKEHGKKAIFWDEVLDLPGASVPKDAIIQVWRFWVKGLVKRAQSKGFRTITSQTWYHDYNNLDWKNMYDRQIEAGDSKLTLGGESCSWSEHAGPSNLDNRIFKTLPAIAERLWSQDSLTQSRDGMTLFRLAAMDCHLRRAAGIRVASPTPDYCPALKHLDTDTVWN